MSLQSAVTKRNVTYFLNKLYNLALLKYTRVSLFKGNGGGEINNGG